MNNNEIKEKLAELLTRVGFEPEKSVYWYNRNISIDLANKRIEICNYRGDGLVNIPYSDFTIEQVTCLLKGLGVIPVSYRHAMKTLFPEYDLDSSKDLCSIGFNEQDLIDMDMQTKFKLLGIRKDCLTFADYKDFVSKIKAEIDNA